jgi:endonuclease G, mitochondrial
MKKVLLGILFVMGLFFAIGGYAQDVVVLTHTNYTSHFSKSKRYPVVVEWWETKVKIGCATPLARKDNFKPDPKLPIETNIGQDYVNSGYDRGHLMPAKSNQCQTPAVQDECFYYSNMAAQTHRLNAGDWKSLETLTREWAVKQDSIRIWAGNVGEIKKIGSVSVPKQCWKVVYVKATNEWFAYLFENDQSKPDGINNNKVDLVDIEKLTGLKFK